MLIAFKFLKKYRAYISSLAFLLLMSFVTVNTELSSLLGANMLNIQSHKPFDGTVYPYSQTVLWTELTDSERLLSFDEVRESKKTSPFKYDERNLAVDFKDLTFRDVRSDQIRNEKITYSVPYMGNYRLDGKAGAGSHAAVDIKLLMRTPIQSIANGIVHEVGDKPSGFGRYVVIKHERVPSIENPANLVTYFSSYSHLDEFIVTKGQVVNKGEKIGYSGNTGTSTTPHLHFQIDRAEAPFYPYWPFTYQESQQAGLSFFEAVNAGLGSDNSRKFTINPLEFVQKNLVFISEVSSDQTDVADSEDVQSDEEPILRPDEVTVDVVVDNKDDVRTELVFNEFPRVVLLGDAVDLNIKLDAGFLLASNQNQSSVKLSSNKRSELSYANNFISGQNKVSFQPREVGRYNLTVEMDGLEYVSPMIEVKLFNDLAVDDVDLPMFIALKKASILQGSEGNMRPEDNVSRAESLTFLVRTLETAKPGFFSRVDRAELSFDDVGSKNWYYDDLRLAASIGSIDSTRANFEPARSVLLPELLKMYFEAMDADIADAEPSNLYDANAWYGKYLAEALRRNLINSSDLRDISKPLSRRDVAKIAYKFLSLVETGRYVY